MLLTELYWIVDLKVLIVIQEYKQSFQTCMISKDSIVCMIPYGPSNSDDFINVYTNFITPHFSIPNLVYTVHKGANRVSWRGAKGISRCPYGPD